MDFSQLATYFASRGVKAVFGIPGGGTSLSLLDALERQGIGFHLTRFEGTGVIVAATMGRLSGKAGLSLSIKGPGLANSVPGLAAAWFEAYPVIHFSEAASVQAPEWQAHKRMDHANLVKAVSKGIVSLGKNNTNLESALTLAEQEEPGPVVVELTEDDRPLPEQTAPTAENAELASILELIGQRDRPLVIAGALAARQGWDKLLDGLNIPVFSTAAAKGVVNETLPHSAGIFTGAGAEMTPEFQLLPKADLVVCLGLTAREVLATKPFSCDSIAVCTAQLPGHEGFAYNFSTGTESLQDILATLAAKSWGLDELHSTRQEMMAFITREFLPGQVFELISTHFGGNARCVLDTGYFCTIGEHTWLAQKTDLCLFSGQGRYMGTGLPMALGASLYDSSIPTVVFLGDGGIGMYLAEAKLAVGNRLPLLIVLMTDNAFGSIRTRAIKDGLTQAPLTLDGGSWVGLLDAMGIPGTRAENLEQVTDALNAWNPESGPAFIEIAFDSDRYEAMVRGIR